MTDKSTWQSNQQPMPCTHKRQWSWHQTLNMSDQSGRILIKSHILLLTHIIHSYKHIIQFSNLLNVCTWSSNMLSHH